MFTDHFVAHAATLVIVFVMTLIVRGNLKDAFEATLHMIVEWILLEAVLYTLTIAALLKS